MDKDDIAPADTTPRRPIWRRPAVLAIAAMALVLLSVPLFCWYVRAQGNAALDAVLARHEAEGLGASPGFLLENPGPYDRAASVELRDLLNRLMPAANMVMFDTRGSHRKWLLGTDETPPKELVAIVTEHGAAIVRAMALLARRDLSLSVVHELPVRFAPGSYPAMQVVSLPIPNMLAAKGVAKALRADALLSDNPLRALEATDGLVAAFDDPGTLITSMIALALREDRDRVWLECAIRGTLTPEEAAPWLDSEDNTIDLAADGLRGERLLYCGCVARDLRDGRVGTGVLTAPAGVPFPALARPAQRFKTWLHGTADMAVVLDRLAAVEQSMRRREAPPRFPDDQELAGGLGDIIAPNFDAARFAALECEDRGRQYRLAARVVLLHRERGALPTDDGELRAWLGERATVLDPQGSACGLRYERLSPEVFRVRRNPDLPLPPSWKGMSIATDEPPGLAVVEKAAFVHRSKAMVVRVR